MSAASSDPQAGPWTGRSGRRYERDPEQPRQGGMASVLRVRPLGGATGDSIAEAGTPLALKLARTDEPLALSALALEASVFATLRSAQGVPPCPRLHDVIPTDDGAGVLGLVMEWCPLDMERWWAEVHTRLWAFSELCEALAEVSLRLREYQQTCASATSQRVAHADVKPRNLLRAQDARWLLTDFGASKARDLDDGDWSATRVILGTESFIAPEGLFNARKSHPEAMDVWSVGATLFALLRMRSHLRAGNPMPLNGTHASAFRSHRAALVSDLHQRKPALFVDKPLDPSQFASPDRLPDKDRAAVAESLDGMFATEAHAASVREATLALLDRAMHIDPARRFADATELAGALTDLARLGRVDDRLDATRVAMVTADGVVEVDLFEPAPDVTGVRPIGGPPPGSAGKAPSMAPAAPAASPAAPAASPAASAASPAASPAAPAASPAASPAAAPAPLPAPRETAATNAEAVKPVEPSKPAEADAAPKRTTPVQRPDHLRTGDAADAEPRQKHVLVGGNARPPTRAPEPAEAAPATAVSAAPLAPPTVPRDARPEPRVSRRMASRMPGWLPVGLSLIVLLQVVAVGLQITQLVVAARTQEPAPAPAPPAAPPTGLVLVAGAEAYLDRIGTPVAIGTVPVGRYTLYALPNGATDFVDLGTVQVEPDARIVYRCSQDGCVRL